MSETYVCLAAVAGAHGVRGLVKLKTFTQCPEDLTAYGALTDNSGKKRFKLTLKGEVKGMLLAQVDGISDRDAAQALRGIELCVPRSQLPETEEEVFYHSDLIGLRVEAESGEALGTVKAVHNFGAGDIIEMDPAGGNKPSEMLSFTRETVPLVDLKTGRLVVNLPEELIVRPDAGLEDED